MSAKFIYMKVIIMYTLCCNKLWKSIIVVVEKPRKLIEFLSYFVATLC